MGCAFYSDCKKCIKVAKNKCNIQAEVKQLRDMEKGVMWLIKQYKYVIKNKVVK